MYERIYKCRMCGEFISKTIAIDELNTCSKLIDLLNNDNNELYFIHHCYDGSMGIAELQGAKNISN